jgi:hypothetical protein
METPHTDFSQDLTRVTRTVEQLSRRLTDVAEQVRASGILPPEGLIGEVATSLRSFTELRDKALELVRLLTESSVETPQAIGSLRDLEALLQMVTEAQWKEEQEEKAHLRALSILDRILSLMHSKDPEFPPLNDVQSKARALRETLCTYRSSEVHPDATALAQGRHPLTEFLTLVEGHDNLEDDIWLLLKHAVAEHFGKSLAISAARGRLFPSPTRLTADPSSEEQRSNPRLPGIRPAFTDGETHNQSDG